MNKSVDKKVLIIGSSAAEYTLAKKLLALAEVSEVYVAPGNVAMKDFCKVVDIRESSTEELLEFALETGIDLTIASSEIAIKNDISTIFHQHNLMIFAPTQASANICLNKSAGKKFMYKTRIPCAKFAIYDKQSMAIDYVSNSHLPLVIKSEEHKDTNGVFVCNSFSGGKNYIEELFESGEQRVIIEDYIFGHEFSFYVITDGYHALPLGSVANYKHELEGDGGNLTSGMGSFSPDYKVSDQIERGIMQQVIYPTLNSLARQHTPYVGVLGVDMVMDETGQFYVIEFNTFLNEPDCEVILALLNEDIYHLLQACVIGSFADDYEKIDIEEATAISCVLSSRKAHAIISGLDELDDNTQLTHFNTSKNAYLEYETNLGRTLAVTRTARVLSKAVKDLYEEISVIKFDGMKFRRDIAKV